MLDNVGFIAANTSRTRAYLAALERNKLLPSWCLLLDDESEKTKIGQTRGNSFNTQNFEPNENAWTESNFDPNMPLEPWLQRLGLNYIKSNTQDIHSDEVIGLIKAAKPDVLIYSGYGGVLLKESVLDCGKNFLHVHGGFLPDYKGSTTNYYSLLAEGSVGATAIFLTVEIDSGPILKRCKFPVPPDTLEIDHIYDSAARAKVLIQTLKEYQEKGEFSYLKEDKTSKNNLYYIIHPVLKHLAILRASS
jgi:methionyl-tRNA formyltransferase